MKRRMTPQSKNSYDNVNQPTNKELKIFEKSRSDIDKEFEEHAILPQLPSPDEFQFLTAEQYEAIIEHRLDDLMKQVSRIADGLFRRLMFKLGIRMKWVIEQDYNEKGLPKLVIEVKEIFLPELPSRKEKMKESVAELKTETKGENAEGKN